ncbi:MAG TPA: hypothetical protein VMG10_00295 [Gemmataceae bacterium]|nr:hypothetical protein [Gemmataceae bacterium]
MDSLVEECQEDHVGLWRIVHAVRPDLGSADPGQTRALALRLVRSLLQERGMEFGFPAPDGRHFLPWDSTLEQAIHCIEDEWIALGCEPNIGELAWFTSAEQTNYRSGG